jgi:hypothetical protein
MRFIKIAAKEHKENKAIQPQIMNRWHPAVLPVAEREATRFHGATGKSNATGG